MGNDCTIQLDSQSKRKDQVINLKFKFLTVPVYGQLLIVILEGLAITDVFIIIIIAVLLLPFVLSMC